MRLPLVVMACCLSCSTPPGGVVITTDSIEFDGERLVGIGDALRFDYLNIPELEEALRGRPEVCSSMQAAPGVPFLLIKRVMFSCAAVDAPRIGFRTTTVTHELNGASRADIGLHVIVTASRVDVRPKQASGKGVELSVDDDVPLQRLLDVAAAQAGPVRIMPSTP